MKLISARVAALVGVVVACMAMSQSVVAQTTEFRTCMYKADGLGFMHNTARLACIDAELKIQDAKLNAAYKSVMASLATDAEVKQKMIESQRAWLRFRDAECAMYAAMGMPLSPKMCLMEKTIERADFFYGISETID